MEHTGAEEVLAGVEGVGFAGVVLLVVLAGSEEMVGMLDKLEEPRPEFLGVLAEKEVQVLRVCRVLSEFLSGVWVDTLAAEAGDMLQREVCT